MSLTNNPLISHAHIALPCDTLPLVMELVKRLGGEIIIDDDGIDDDIDRTYYNPPPIPEHERIGRMLKGLRYRANMTQKELAKAIEVPQGHISEYEANKRPIPKAKAALLAEILKTVETQFTPR